MSDWVFHILYTTKVNVYLVWCARQVTCMCVEQQCPGLGIAGLSGLSFFLYCCWSLLQRYTAQPNVTVAPRVITDRSALQRYNVLCVLAVTVWISTLHYRTLLESRPDGPTPSALNSPGGIRDDSILGLAPAKPALNELPSPSSGKLYYQVHVYMTGRPKCTCTYDRYNLLCSCRVNY